MVLLVLFDAMVTAEINLAAFVFDGFRFIDGLTRDRAGFIDGNRVPLFLRHLGYERLGILVELVDATFATKVDELAFVFGAELFANRSAANRARLVRRVFLFINGDATRNSSNKRQCN